MGWFSRYRHTKGFGVHSPFAFRLITEVIGERCPYYAYSQLRSQTERLIFRLACRFKPSDVYASDKALLQAVTLGYTKVKKAQPGNADMTILSGDPSKEVLKSAMEKGRIVVLVGKAHRYLPRLREMMSDTGHGMVFDNCKNMAIAVPDPKLPFQYFDLNF